LLDVHNDATEDKSDATFILQTLIGEALLFQAKFWLSPVGG
jgi:hypothetical protein